MEVTLPEWLSQYKKDHTKYNCWFSTLANVCFHNVSTMKELAVETLWKLTLAWVGIQKLYLEQVYQENLHSLLMQNR